MDGTVHVIDVSDPHKPVVAHEQKIGKQLNMVSQSWDGKRVYFTSSLLANWDKTGDDDEQFLRVYDWNGKTLEKRFELDFLAAKLGRPHIMNFGSEDFYRGKVAVADGARVKRAIALLALAAAIAAPALAHEVESRASRRASRCPRPAATSCRRSRTSTTSRCSTKPAPPRRCSTSHRTNSPSSPSSTRAAATVAAVPPRSRCCSDSIARSPPIRCSPPHVRLATVSFDPAHDTPARMAELRRALTPHSDWRFLTATGPGAIAPVLAAFGQDALPLVGSDERALGLYRHVLKVFLVDARGAVRNIYSSGFLSPELLLVDARTVLDSTHATLAGAPSR